MTNTELLELVKKSKERNTREYIWMEYLKDAPVNSIFAEFGVWNGKSINYMAAARPDCYFHGFDSFEGLPEEWVGVVPKGHFKTNLSALKFRNNVKIYPGIFSDTIPHAMKLVGIYGIHIDCDLGSSTTTVLDGMTELLLQSKPFILFDEFVNYKQYEAHEFQSFLTWINKTNARFEVIAQNKTHQQVLIKLT